MPAPTLSGLITTWAVEPLAVAALGWLAIGYVLVYRHPRIARRRERKRLVAFIAGCGLVAATAFGPLCAFDNTFLTAHMIQHFLLITIAPPLLLAGAPMTYLLIALGREGRARWVYPITHSRSFLFLTNPIIGLALFLIVPAAWYVTPLFALSLRYDLLHWAGYVIFLLAGVHYWWPVIGGNPTRWSLPHPVRVGYLFALMPIHAFLGMLFYSPERLLYPELAEASRNWGPSPLLDQQFAGMLMLVAGEMIGLIALLIGAAQWANADERAAARFDRARARQADREEGLALYR